MSRDGIAGLVVLVLSLVLYGLTFRIQANSLVPVSPAFYPRMVLGASAVLALALVATDVFAQRKRRGVPEAARARPRYGLVAILFAIFAVYVVALPYLGFRISTVAFLAVMQAVMEFPRSTRRWMVLGAVALAGTLVAYYTFDTYLQVLLPRGLWSGF
jgi:putative tricarboxylic transport membrane protein